MASAADLEQASDEAWDVLEPFAIAGTLRASLLAFCAEAIVAFPQSTAAGHPVANWLSVLYGFATTMASTANDYSLLRIGAQYVYRTCLMGYQLVGTLPTETTALLDAYNNNF